MTQPQRGSSAHASCPEWRHLAILLSRTDQRCAASPTAASLAALRSAATKVLVARVDVADGTGARAVRDLGPLVADDRHATSPPLQATESL